MSPASWAALALAALALSGCETTAEKSAKLQKQAKHVTLAQTGLEITRESTDVKVLEATVVKGPEGAAAVVMLQNRSASALREVPIAITVKNSAGQTLFQNNGPGLERALVSVSLLGPHRTVAWVDDQLPASGAPASVSARVGQAPALSASVPALTVERAHLSEDPSNGVVAIGTVSNHSRTAQSALVLFGVARRGGRIVAAGRGVLPSLAAGASKPFQVFLIGDARAAQVQVSAPSTSFG
jgi:hypothetical protein